MGMGLTYVSSTTNSALLRGDAWSYSLPREEFGDWGSWRTSYSSSSMEIEYCERSHLTYSNLRCEWRYNGSLVADDTYSYARFSVSGLRAGLGNNVTIRMTAYCTLTRVVLRMERSRYSSTVPGGGGDGSDTGTPGGGSVVWSDWDYDDPYDYGNPTYSLYTWASESDTITIYTRPNDFSWSGRIRYNETIELNLYASDWNDLVTTIENKLNWESLSDSYTGAYGSARVSRGEVIRASKYNTLANALGLSRVSNDPEARASLITAERFTDLEDAVND